MNLDCLDVGGPPRWQSTSSSALFLDGDPLVQVREYPTAEWLAQQTMEACDRPISPRSPWQNPYAEQLIGSIMRDRLDHVLIFSEHHLRRVLILYSHCYNETCTHLGLGKDAPLQ